MDKIPIYGGLSHFNPLNQPLQAIYGYRYCLNSLSNERSNLDNIWIGGSFRIRSWELLSLVYNTGWFVGYILKAGI